MIGEAVALAVALFFVVRWLWRREDNGMPHAESGILGLWIAFFGIIVVVFMLL